MLALALAAATVAASPAAAPDPRPPALGWDWMPTVAPVEARTEPDRWPLADAAAAGLDDAIHADRVQRRLEPDDAFLAHAPHLVRTAIRASGAYWVLPIHRWRW